MFLIPILFFNKLIYNATFFLFSKKPISSTFNYFFVLIILLVNRYFVQLFNILVYKYWTNDPLSLNQANRLVNKISVQQFIYFTIAIILMISQIDKGLYNVFNKEIK